MTDDKDRKSHYENINEDVNGADSVPEGDLKID